jgi:hypothetical protein
MLLEEETLIHLVYTYRKDWRRDDDDPDHRTFLFSMTRRFDEWTMRKDSMKGVD